jgi:hypothetical protein
MGRTCTWIGLVALFIWVPGALLEASAQTEARVTVPNVSVSKGKVVPVKITVQGVPSPGLRDFQGRLTFNAQVVRAQSVSGLNGYSIAAVNLDTPGEVRFIGFKVSGTLITQGEFLQIDLQAVGDPGDRSTLELRLQSFNTPTAIISHEVVNGQLTVTAAQTLQANFSFSPGDPEVNEEIQFTDASTGGGILNTWDWNFGDNSTSTLQNPVHKYTQAGNYTVRLTVRDDQGTTSTISKTVTVLLPGQRPSVTVHVFPNPARTSATFVYGLPQRTTSATLYIFDVTGRTVFTRDLPLSADTVSWNLRNPANEAVPNGPYYYLVRAVVSDQGVLSSPVSKLVLQR